MNVCAQTIACFQAVAEGLLNITGVTGSGNASTANALVSLSKNDAGANMNVSLFSANGIGTVLGNTAILQDRAYWEVTVVRNGPFYVGVSQRIRKSNPSINHSYEDQLVDRNRSWALKSSSLGALKVDDTIGIALDNTGIPTIIIYVNGVHVSEIKDIKGEVYPAVSMETDDAILEFRFNDNDFRFPPANSTSFGRPFTGIIPARSVIG